MKDNILQSQVNGNVNAVIKGYEQQGYKYLTSRNMLLTDDEYMHHNEIRKTYNIRNIVNVYILGGIMLYFTK